MFVFEIKEDDRLNRANPAQLRDYLWFVGRPSSRVSFAHISRYSPTNDDRKALSAGDQTRVRSYLYHDIHRRLQCTREKPMAKLLSDYLSDIGVARYQAIELTDAELRLFLARALGFPHRQGLGRIHSKSAIDALPDLIKTIFGNLSVLGEWIRNANQKLVYQTNSRSFETHPYYDLKRLQKALSKGEIEDEAEIPGKYGQFVKSGSVLFYAHGSISPRNKREKGGWLSYFVGFDFCLERNPKDKNAAIELSVFAAFQGRGLNWVSAEKKFANFRLRRKSRSSFPGFLILQGRRRLQPTKLSGIPPSGRLPFLLNPRTPPSACR